MIENEDLLEEEDEELQDPLQTDDEDDIEENIDPEDNPEDDDIDPEDDDPRKHKDINWDELSEDELREKAKEIEGKNKQLYARVKKAGKGKGTKPKKDSSKKNNKQDTQSIVAEEVFVQGGGSEEEVEKIKTIMQGTGKTFREAQKDDLFVAFKEAKDTKKKKRDGQLGPSGGGGGDLNNKETRAEKELSGGLPPGFTPPKE